MRQFKVINRIDYRTIESNLVYPNWTDKREYQVLGKLDAEFVKDFLEREFDGVERINNKYAISIPNGTLWYQHDHSTFILKQINGCDYDEDLKNECELNSLENQTYEG